MEPASFAVPCPETLKSPALPEAMYLTAGGYLSLKSCAIDDLLADFKEELNETRSQYTKRRLELNRRMRSAKKGDAEAEKQREALSEAHLREDPESEESYCDPCEEELWVCGHGSALRHETFVPKAGGLGQDVRGDCA